MPTQTMLFGTDLGPECPHCGGTIYAYRFEQRWEDVGDRPHCSAVPICKGCETIEPAIVFGRMSQKALEAFVVSTIRKAHVERHLMEPQEPRRQADEHDDTDQDNPDDGMDYDGHDFDNDPDWR